MTGLPFQIQVCGEMCYTLIHTTLASVHLKLVLRNNATGIHIHLYYILLNNLLQHLLRLFHFHHTLLNYSPPFCFT